MPERRFYVISYDITDNAKRAKAAEILKDYGRRVQKSVFECRLATRSLDKLLEKLRSLVDKESDNVVVYLLCEACLKQKRSEGMEIIGLVEEEYRVL